MCKNCAPFSGPIMPLSISMAGYIIAFDVGGTRLKTGILSEDGQLLECTAIHSDTQKGAAFLEAQLAAFTEATMVKRGKPMGIGLSLSGGVDPEFGVVLLPGKYKDLEGYPLVPKLRERFHVPVFANNDGRLAMYAARYFGKAREVDWAVVLTIGTGIGSGVLLNGTIMEDPHFQFGTQLGHLVQDTTSKDFCLTGNFGTGESQCSATALALRVRSAIQRGVPSLLSGPYFENPLQVDFEAVIQACKKGDRVCLRELDGWIANLAVLVINSVHAYAPQRVILSGGATLASHMFLDKLTTMVNRHVFHVLRGKAIAIVVEEDQEYTGVKGAAAYLLKRLKK